ncbi:FG-GAP repeat domain-containing protein, partial [Limnobacter sp.]|uniref:FG-GAP repeat domain-containing protein n=1 Tax=Limnobacter sp. TaxID=2003368 RepID=UPI00391DD78B
FGYGSETARYGTPVQRTDKSLAYMAGFAMRSNQRLSGVRTLINATATASGNTWTVSGTQVNEYRLIYKSSSITSRALLSSVTECAGSTNCLPAVSLGWADTLEAPGWYAMPGYEPPYHHFADGIGKFLVQYLDLNGDGLTDIAYHRVAIGVEQKSAYINTGSGWLENKNFTPPFHITADQIGDLSARFIDFNSDGLVDMVYNRHFSSSVQSGAYQNTGEGWIAKPEFTPLFHITADGTGDLSARFLDVNGDGRVDEVYHRHHSGGIQAGAYLNTGNGWQQNLAFTPPFHITADGTGDLSVRFIDFNSDGLADIVFHRVHAGGRQSGAYQNTGVGWQERFEYTPPFHITADSVGDLGVRFIDLNGDGLVDMAYNRFFSGQVQSGAYLNTGKGWIENLAFTPPYHIVADGLGDLATRFIDVNSDGLLDFVFHRQSGPTVFKGAYLNTGSGWIKNTSFDPPYHMFVDGVGDIDVQLFDIDGDSSPEILYHRVFSGGVQKGAFRASRSRDLLISSDTRGFPGTPEMKAAYGFSSKMNARFREFQRPLTAYPRVNFSPSIPVIEKVEVLNGVGLFNGIRYKYGAALLDLIVGGRGFLGFEWMESQMTGSDGVSMPALRTTYSQQWPCLGMAVQSQVKLPSGGLREQSDSIIRVRTPANATAQTCGTAALNGQITIPYLSDSTTRQWEMTSTAQQGVELPRKRTLTTMDGYGNATQVQEQTLNADGTASGYSRTTTNTYDSNAERARQGRLIRSTVTHVKP